MPYNMPGGTYNSGYGAGYNKDGTVKSSSSYSGGKPSEIGGSYNSGYGSKAPSQSSRGEGGNSSLGTAPSQASAPSFGSGGSGSLFGSLNPGFSGSQFANSPLAGYSNPNSSGAALRSVVNGANLAFAGNAPGQVDYMARNAGITNPYARASLLGSWGHESAGYDPNVISGQRRGDMDMEDSAYGIGQWRSPREEAVKRYMAQSGLPFNNAASQAAAGLNEMQGQYPGMFGNLMGAQNIPQGVAAMNAYERPRGYKPGGDPTKVSGWTDRINRSNRYMAGFDTNQAMPQTQVASNDGQMAVPPGATLKTRVTPEGTLEQYVDPGPGVATAMQATPAPAATAIGGAPASSGYTGMLGTLADVGRNAWTSAKANYIDPAQKAIDDAGGLQNVALLSRLMMPGGETGPEHPGEGGNSSLATQANATALASALEKEAANREKSKKKKKDRLENYRYKFYKVPYTEFMG